MRTSIRNRMVLAVAGWLVLGCMCPTARAADTTAAIPNVNLELTDVDAKMAIKMLFDSVGRNYATDQDVQGTIPSLRFVDVPFETALKNLVRSAGLVYRLDGDIYVISKKVAAAPQAPAATPDVAVVDTTTAVETTIEKVPLNHTGASEILQMMGTGANSGSYGGMGGMGNMGSGMGSGMGNMGSGMGNMGSSYGSGMGNMGSSYGGSNYGSSYGSNRSYGSSSSSYNRSW